MDAANTALYTAFVSHAIMVVFIAASYAFAGRFLANRALFALALGWLANAVYLALESLQFQPYFVVEHEKFEMATAL